MDVIETKIETKTKKYDQNRYNRDFKDKQKDKKYTCEVCNKEYTYYSKSKHIKSQYHKLAESFKNNQTTHNI